MRSKLNYAGGESTISRLLGEILIRGVSAPDIVVDVKKSGGVWKEASSRPSRCDILFIAVVQR